MVKVRSKSNNNAPPPLYSAGDLSLTVRLHFGGKFASPPSAEYVGGSVYVIDHVGLDYMSVEGLKNLCDGLGLVGVKGCYFKIQSGGMEGYKLIYTNGELKQCFIWQMKKQNGREMIIYVDSEIQLNLEAEASLLGTGVGQDELNDSVCEGEGVSGEQYDADENILEYFSDPDYDMASDTDLNILVGDEERAEPDDEMVDVHVEDLENDIEITKSESGREDIGVDEDRSVGSVSDSGEDNVVESGDELDSAKGSDEDEDGIRYPVFNVADMHNPQFQLGMKFATKKMFREAVHSHAIKDQRTIKIKKNDKERVHAKCPAVGCKWHLHAIKLKHEDTWQVRAYHEKHKCPKSSRVQNLKSRWIGDMYMHLFKSDPGRKVKAFVMDKKKETKLQITLQQGYRAKSHALTVLNGEPSKEYSLLWDFVDEIQRTNPDSTLILGTQAENIFDRFYMCLGPVKKGFLAGCRPVVGFDGCHLKGPYAGVLLTAVGIDANNNIYPIAWAPVEKEDGDTWAWFLTILKVDLEIVRNDEWTFMSDKQKGLIQAFQRVFPRSDHRFCVRHLHGNFKQAGFTGVKFKDALWKAARATTVSEWKVRMNEMKALSEEAHKWFEDKPATQWSKSHFNTYPKCDILLNNGCEAFNACINEAREKPILSMMEWLTKYIMTRHQKNRDRAMSRWSGLLCPKIQKIIDSYNNHLNDCIAHKSNDQNYQVECWDGSQYKVNLKEGTCGCRKWDLSGIPCIHAASAIDAQGLKAENFVAEKYHLEAYRAAYRPFIVPINGRLLRKKSDYIPPLPPMVVRTVGRPQKARRNEPDEPVIKQKKRGKGKPLGVSTKSKSKLKRQQRTVTCKFCGETGHNLKGCPVKKQASSRDTNVEVNVSQFEFNSSLADLDVAEVDINSFFSNDDFGQGQCSRQSRGLQQKKLPVRRKTTIAKSKSNEIATSRTSNSTNVGVNNKGERVANNALDSTIGDIKNKGKGLGIAPFKPPASTGKYGFQLNLTPQQISTPSVDCASTPIPAPSMLDQLTPSQRASFPIQKMQIGGSNVYISAGSSTSIARLNLNKKRTKKDH